MSPGYGQRIYRKKPGPPWWLLTVLAIIVGSWLLFSLLRDSRTPEPLPPSAAALPAGNQKPVADRPATPPPQPAVADPGPENRTVRQPQESRQDATTRGRAPTESLRIENRADELFRGRRYREALQVLDSDTNPGNDHGALRGRCHYHLQEYERAVEYLSVTVARYPRDFISRKYLALSLYQLDDLENCLAHTRQALSLRADPELAGLRDRLLREVPVMDDYADGGSPYFKILFSRFDHADIRSNVRDILRTARREIGREIAYYPSQPVTVILYNEKAFFDVTRAPGWAGGLYDGKIRIPVGGLEGRQDVLRRVLYHEYVHALVHAITVRCPVWLNEGLAEYFSADYRWTGGQVLPLQALERGFPAAPPQAVAVAYRQSRAVVAHLIDTWGKRRMREILEFLGRGGTLSAAFREIYHTSYEQFAATWGREDGQP